LRERPGNPRERLSLPRIGVSLCGIGTNPRSAIERKFIL
jgi:hypothetical protein